MSKTKKSRSENAVSYTEEGQDQQNIAVTSPQVEVELPADAKDLKKEKKRKRKDREDNDDVKVSKKAKKAKKSDGATIEEASREVVVAEDKKDKKSRKRKETEEKSEESAMQSGEDSEKKNKKKDKKEKKSKKSTSKTEAALAEKLDDAANSKDKPGARESTLERDFIGFDGDAPAKFESTFAEHEASLQKPKKRTKKEKLAERADIIEAYAMEVEKESKTSAPETNGTDVAPQDETAEATEGAPARKKERFIVFVGNLPFTATKESLQQHFAKLEPIDIRMMTEKDTGRTKGYAFVEFDRKDRMATCLKKFHHSLHPDGGKGRRMNIEVTVGGGGKNDGRRSKLETKNEKLQRERQREHERNEELREKRRIRKEKKERKMKKQSENKASNDAAPSAPSDEPSSEHGGIHPSRLAMMQRPAPSAWKTKRGRY